MLAMRDYVVTMPVIIHCTQKDRHNIAQFSHYFQRPGRVICLSCSPFHVGDLRLWRLVHLSGPVGVGPSGSVPHCIHPLPGGSATPPARRSWRRSRRGRGRRGPSPGSRTPPSTGPTSPRPSASSGRRAPPRRPALARGAPSHGYENNDPKSTALPLLQNGGVGYLQARS